ncbi:hypothetical protein BS50DRAFT_73023 [Corynespora cassiicola Philippines]|uniref:Uncharacterized protein n=1 Tax=Corynespora cassiicola Philippines TaxID=1448308 RepID=A0A2T2NGN0_CORCC|nr:hypothetical protein BS50DRAFT_73023 [Corynespora cassiicola Philippines]
MFRFVSPVPWGRIEVVARLRIPEATETQASHLGTSMHTSSAPGARHATRMTTHCLSAMGKRRGGGRPALRLVQDKRPLGPILTWDRQTRRNGVGKSKHLNVTAWDRSEDVSFREGGSISVLRTCGKTAARVPPALMRRACLRRRLMILLGNSTSNVGCRRSLGLLR